MDDASRHGSGTPEFNSKLAIHQKQTIEGSQKSSHFCKKSNLDFSSSSQSSTSETLSSSQDRPSLPAANNAVSISIPTSSSTLSPIGFNNEDVCNELAKETHQQIMEPQAQTVAISDHNGTIGKEYYYNLAHCENVRYQCSDETNTLNGLTSILDNRGHTATENHVNILKNQLPVEITARHSDDDIAIPPMKLISVNELTSDRTTDDGESAGEGNRQRCTQFFQSPPPREITMHVAALPNIVRKVNPPANPPRSEPLETHQSQENDTPPPSYQESSKYPLVQKCPCRQPLDFVSVEAMTSHQSREPRVSFITLTDSRPHSQQIRDDARCHSIPAAPGGANGITDDFVFVQGTNDEACPRYRNKRRAYSDHQLLALLSCIIFWPIGLIAVYYANTANILQAEGIHGKAAKYSKRALSLSLLSLGIGTILFVVFYVKRIP